MEGFDVTRAVALDFNSDLKIGDQVGGDFAYRSGGIIGVPVHTGTSTRNGTAGNLIDRVPSRRSVFDRIRSAFQAAVSDWRRDLRLMERCVGGSCHGENLSRSRFQMEEKLSSIEENGSRTDEIALTITDTAIRDEMAGAIKTFGRPVSDDEKMPTRIARAGRACNLTFSQARRLWYREWQNVPGHIVDSIRARVDRARFVAIEAERKRIAKVMAEINEWERISIARDYQLDRRRVAPGQRHELGHIEETGCGG